ncbi:hypothetical protein, partial [Akkermansia sp.]|uniref:hypothetical protein n=1 Tax=Akkermansia sp. TaxID=1872421 RepID=UPI003AB46C8D
RNDAHWFTCAENSRERKPSPFPLRKMTAGFCHSRMDIRLKDAPFNQKRLFLILLRYHPVPLQLPQRFAALLTAKEGKPGLF